MEGLAKILAEELESANKIRVNTLVLALLIHP